MVRLVGDGSLSCQITDMAVLPDHHGRGLGSRILDELIRWIDLNCPDAYVSGIADPAGERLSVSRGFVFTKGKGMRRSPWGL